MPKKFFKTTEKKHLFSGIYILEAFKTKKHTEATNYEQKQEARVAI